MTYSGSEEEFGAIFTFCSHRAQSRKFYSDILLNF